MGTNCVSCVCSKTGTQSVIENDFEELCCNKLTESNVSSEVETNALTQSNTTTRSSVKVKKKSAFDVKKRKNQSCLVTNYKTGIPLTEFLSQKDDF